MKEPDFRSGQNKWQKFLTFRVNLGMESMLQDRIEPKCFGLRFLGRGKKTTSAMALVGWPVWRHWWFWIIMIIIPLIKESEICKKNFLYLRDQMGQWGYEFVSLYEGLDIWYISMNQKIFSINLDTHNIKKQNLQRCF